MKLCKYTSMQLYKYASMQACKYGSMPVCTYAHMQVYNYACIQVCNYSGMQVGMYGFMHLCTYGKLSPGATFHYEFCCCFPQPAHTLHALESSISIEILCCLLRLSDLDLMTTISSVKRRILTHEGAYFTA